MHPLLVICGPTATGKTALAVKLAKLLNGELISADSRQVYIGMDIGTGKDIHPDAKPVRIQRVSLENRSYSLPAYVLDGVPIWMYDVVLPDETFSVSQYAQLATSVIEVIRKSGKLPIIVGGTGLYINALLSPHNTFRIKPDPQLRETLNSLSVIRLQQRLKQVDPRTYALLNDSDSKNPRRLIRKIEIAESGVRISELSADPPNAEGVQIGLYSAQRVLFERINARVDIRASAGIVAEIHRLLETGYSWDLPSFSSLGYSEWRPYMEAGERADSTLYAQVVEKWKYDEHRYAKRQLTWFKKQDGIEWFDIANPDYLRDVTRKVSSWYTGIVNEHKV